MQFSLIALVSALAASTAVTAATIRDLPTSATYYVADIEQTCTFAKDEKIECSPGRVGDAKDLPQQVTDAIILAANRPPIATDPNGPANLGFCLGLHW